MAKKSSKVSAAPATYSEPKRVTIEKAGNGFVVEHHSMNGRKSMVAKTPAEAMKHIKKLMK
jgi:hypothetical protein